MLRPSFAVWCLGLSVSMLLISGCGTTTYRASTATSAPSPTAQASQAGPSRTQALIATRLTLPNGVLVTPTRNGIWHHITFSLAVQGSGGPPGTGPRYLGVIDNHSSVVQHSTVTLPMGQADFVSVKMTPPATTGSTTPTYQYWLIVYKSRYTYAIVGTVPAFTNHGAEEMLAVAKHWTIPAQ